MSVRRGLRLAAVLLLLATQASAQRVAVISDLNGSYGSTAYEHGVSAGIARLLELKPDLVVITGDMVAGQRLHPPLAGAAIAAMWHAFHAAVTTPLRNAGIPLAVTPGNHDASAYPGFAAERDAYRREWSDRDLGITLLDRGDFPFRYAFAVGEMLFVSLDVTTVGPLAPDQLAWLDQVLATHGPRYRHRVAFSHLPIHPFAVGRATEVTSDLALEALLARHGVQVYLSGHHHAFYPGYHGGVRHVGQACLGAGPRPLLGDTAPSARAITLLEADGHGRLAIGALTGPGFEHALEVSRLPRRVGVLVRDDLRPAGTP